MNIGGTTSSPPVFPTSNTGTFNASATGNTVNFYQGSLTISTPSIVSTYPTYYNLTISGSGTKSLPNNTTIAVNGDLTLNSTLSGASATRILRLRGNWTDNTSSTNTGFTEGTGTVIFDGTGDQHIIKSVTQILNNTIIDKPGGTLYLNTDVKVGSNSNTTSTLTMIKGNINCGDHTLTLGKGTLTGTQYTGVLSYTSGIIIGKFERHIESSSSPGGAVLFPIGTSLQYRPAEMLFTSVDPGSVIIEFNAAFPGSLGLAGGLQDTPDAVFSYNTFRDGYWTLTDANALANAAYNLSLTGNGFTINPPTVVIDNNTRLLRRADDSVPWGFSGSHVTYTSGNKISRSGLTVFGQFAFGDDTNCSSPPPLTFTGANSVCTNTTNSEYLLTSFTNTSTYSWTVSGQSSFSLTGSQAVNNSEKISVNWGANPVVGSVKVYETTAAGCSGPEQTLLVNVQALPPSVVTGTTEVPENNDISNPKPTVTYTTPLESYYTEYEWTVTGGKIVFNSVEYSSLTTVGNSVDIRWETVGTGKVCVKGKTASCGTSTSSTCLTVNIYNLIYTVGSGNGNWANNNNALWSCNCIPASTDNVMITNGRTVTVTNANANNGVTVRNLIVAGTLNTGTTIGRTITVTGHLTFINGTIGGNTNSLILAQGTTLNPFIDGVGTLLGAAALSINSSRKILSSATITKSSGAVAIGSSASNITVTNFGTVTLGGSLTGNANGTSGWTNEVNSVLNFNGTDIFSIGGGMLNASSTGNLINYGGDAAQTVKATQYYRLSFSGLGSKTLPGGTISILNDFTNDATMVAAGTVDFNGTSNILGDQPPNFYGLKISGSLNSSALNINVAGNFVDDGIFNANNGTVTFNGTVASNIDGNAAVTMFNNLTANNPAGVFIEKKVDLSGILTLGAGASFDADGDENTSVFTLLSTNDAPAADAGIAALPDITKFTGNVTVQRYFRAKDNTDRFISSPILNATVSQLQGATPLGSFPVTGGFPGSSFPCTGCLNNGHSFRYYKESAAGIINKGYTPFITSDATTLVPGVGYDSWMWNGVSNTTVSFRGSINKGVISLGLSGGITHTSNGVPSADGYNLVGNPYPSAIQWNNGPGWSRTNIDPHIWAWDVVGGVWHTYNADTQVGDLTNGIIASGQAFWVYASTPGVPGVGSITINEQAKSTAGPGTYYRKSGSSLATLNMSLSHQGATDNSFLVIEDKATLAYDPGLDALKLEMGFEHLSGSFIDQGGNKLVQYAVNSIPDDQDIPISIFAQAEGNLSLSFTSTNEFPGFEEYYLIDSYLGKSSKISEGAYHFTINSNAKSDRFYLSRKLLVTEVSESRVMMSCYPNPATDRFTVEINSEDVQHILLIDHIGRVLEDISFQTDMGVTRGDVKMNALRQGMYIIKVVAAGGTYIQRVVKN